MHLFRLTLPVLAGLLLTTTLSAQTVSGVVNDDNGQPLPGATVLANGGARGVSTDMDGRYTLSLGAGTHSNDYSFVGYLKANRSVTLAAGETKVINVQLETDAVMMDDVVVVGYGVQRRKEVTGSIAQIDSKQITAVRTPSFEAALQGQAAGVQVSQSSGVAGAGVKEARTGISFPPKSGSAALTKLGVRTKGPIKVYAVGLYEGGGGAPCIGFAAPLMTAFASFARLLCLRTHVAVTPSWQAARKPPYLPHGKNR